MGAFVIDAVVIIIVLTTVFFAIWTVRTLGGLPETPAETAVRSTQGSR